MLGVVGSNLKIVKFFVQHLWMLHDVVIVWPGLYNNVALGHAHLFDFQLPTWRKTLQQGRTVAKRIVAPSNVTICCAEKLRSFGPEFVNVGPKKMYIPIL